METNLKVSISAVWDRTSEFLSDNMTAVAGIAALTFCMPYAIEDVLAPLGESGDPTWKLGLGVLAVLLFVVALWGQLAIIALALEPVAGAGDAGGRATRRLGAAVLVMLALMAVGVVLALPLVGILIESGSDLAQFKQPGDINALTPGTVSMIGTYLLVAIPVAFWLFARIAVLQTAVVVAENLSLGALARSFRLTRGLALKIIGVLILYAVVVVVATRATTSVVGGLSRLMLTGEGPITIASVLTALVVAAVQSIFTAIAAAFVAKLYLATRTRETAVPDMTDRI